MDEERLNLLSATIRAQNEEIERIFDKIEDRRRGEGEATLESLAYQLHNLYCAFEDLLKLVADSFENHIEASAYYHRRLLWRMKIPIEGVRPALLSETSHKLLDSLRAFRHVFRHAYSYELDPKKLALVVEDVLKLKRLYQGEIDRFLEQLQIGGGKL